MKKPLLIAYIGIAAVGVAAAAHIAASAVVQARSKSNNKHIGEGHHE